MIKLKEMTGKYQSLYAAEKALEVSHVTLKRWLENGAVVDVNGDVYIKTKSGVNLK